ncbi:MAG: lactamase [Chloroflexi bacterium HGW-Chloroflexi-10]|nr:MAG: lactamase [Chloroflexi bacterium HGW-Chloroflexi-10]
MGGKGFEISMEITWYGHSCFRISERGFATVVTDPYDGSTTGHGALHLNADIVTVSHNKPGHNHVRSILGDPFIISGPGEYEIGGVFVTGLQTNGHHNNVTIAERNTMYVYDFDGINIVHLGGIDRVPSQSEIEEIGTIHVALVPIGGNSTLNAAKAAEIITLIEPNIVIPMHYMTENSLINLDPLNKFLKEMGLSNIEPLGSLKLTNLRSLPEETQVIVLEAQDS